MPIDRIHASGGPAGGQTFKKFDKYILSLMILLLLHFPVLAQTGGGRLCSPDADEEGMVDAPGGLDAEAPLEAHLLVPAAPQAAETDSNLAVLWRKRRLSYRHELAAHTQDLDRVIINRATLRLQWEHLTAQQLFLHFDGKAVYNAAYDFESFPASVADRYRFQLKLRQCYVQARSGVFGLTAGRQIVVWGEADGALVTDVISPRDMTEFIFTPLEDTRVPQDMLTLNGYWDTGYLMLTFNPEPQTNVFAPKGHPYAMPSFLDAPNITALPEKMPPHTLKDAEWGMRFKKTIGQSDLSLMAADVLDDTPVYRIMGMTSDAKIIVQPIYKRFRMIGVAANRANGKFLWKMEAAFKPDRYFNGFPLNARDGIRPKAVFDTAWGFDYDENGAYTISLEYANQYIHNAADLLYTRRNTSTLYGTFGKNYRHDLLKTQYTAAYQIQDEDLILRFEATYDFTDVVIGKISGTYFLIKSEQGPLGLFHDNHRVAMELTWHF